MGTETDLFSLVGRRLAGKYHVERVVARGGFGLVYQGLHTTLKKQVAIKVLIVPAEFNDGAREAFMQGFLREAETIAQLRHTAIVQVLDSGVDAMPSGTTAPWMVLEWIDGQTLEDHLNARRGRGGRSPAEVLSTLRPVLEALAYAHDMGIAHRDIKPANMMLPANTPRLSRHGVPGIQLLDFGIAKVMDPSEQSGAGATRTMSKHRAFSPAYAAPEQVGGSRTGPWTDVHAMGLILTEMLTDQSPFRACDQTELFIKVLSSQRPTPGAVGVDVGAWEAVIARSLSLMPRDRYQSAEELLAALEENPPSVLTRTAPMSTGTLPVAPPIPPMFVDPAPFLATREASDPVTSHSTLRALETPTAPVVPPQGRSKDRLALGALLFAALAAGAIYLSVGTHSASPSPSSAVQPSPPVTALPSPPVVTSPPAQQLVPAPVPGGIPGAMPAVALAPMPSPAPVVTEPVAVGGWTATIPASSVHGHRVRHPRGEDYSSGRGAGQPPIPAPRPVAAPRSNLQPNEI